MSEETLAQQELTQEEMVTDIHEQLMDTRDVTVKSTGFILFLSILSTLVNMSPAAIIYFVISQKMVIDPVSILLICGFWLITAHFVAIQLKDYPKANMFDLSTSMVNLLAIGYILYSSGIYTDYNIVQTIGRLESSPSVSIVDLFFFQASIYLLLLSSILDTFYIGFYINWKENKMYQESWEQYVEEENHEHILEISYLKREHEEEIQKRDKIITTHHNENIQLGEELELAKVEIRQKNQRLEQLSA